MDGIEALLGNPILMGVLGSLLFLLIMASIPEQIKKHTLATREVAAEIRELRHLLEADARNAQMYSTTYPKPYVPQYKTDISGNDGSEKRS